MLPIPSEGVRHDERYHDDDQPCQPVCVGRDLRRHCFFAPLWEQVQLPQKSVRYRPIEKVLDGLLGILCGAKTIAQSNSTIRVDPAVQRAFGRTGCAEQSTIARTLQASTAETVDQLSRVAWYYLIIPLC